MVKAHIFDSLPLILNRKRACSNAGCVAQIGHKLIRNRDNDISLFNKQYPDQAQRLLDVDCLLILDCFGMF